MTTATATARKVTDKVGIDHDDPRWSGIWTVTKVNTTTYSLRRDSDGTEMRCPKPMVTDPPTGAAAAAAAARPVFHPGTVVRYNNPKAPKTLYVVGKDAGARVNVYPIGGQADGGGWRANPASLTIVPAAEILAAYQAAGGKF